MSNYFLKVNKDLFKLGLNPTEILLLAQIMEFNTNTGDCFISDKTLADNFGVSESTIKREIKKLEELGFITRDTKNVKGGKERHIKANIDKVEEQLTSVKMSFDKNNNAQNELCTSVKMSFDKGQIDTIKDNILDKEKDNNSVVISASAESNHLQERQEVAEINGKQAQVMTGMQALSKYGLSACANRVASGIKGCYWIKGELVQLVAE